MPRHYSTADQILSRLSDSLGLFASKPALRDNPASGQADLNTDNAVRQHAAGLMRINHAGEVSAQALYHGQALTARDENTREHLLEAAAEEAAHLQWCEQRLQELGSGPSKLQPLWAAGSFAIGAVAGLAGDKWSLGFVEETEKQVSDHLSDHLEQLPAQDGKSRAILQAMRADEQRHGAEAKAAGAQPLPEPVKVLMQQVAKLMKFGAYRF